MPFRSAFVVILTVLFFTGCASTLTSDIEVETETAPRVNLNGYKTYAWLGSAQIVYDPEGQWEPPAFDADAEIRRMINAALRDKGFIEVASGPDVLVGFAAGIDMEALEIREHPEEKLQTLENVPRGALVIMLVDPATRHPVWVGEALAKVQKKISAEDVKKRLQYAVDRMFGQMER
ncbi:MAG TPA: DUF4136 domain-containing protein [Chromatiales bacterium]|nr:DUF4136 domain-containing protein [Chromatiales bacterium]